MGLENDKIIVSNEWRKIHGCNNKVLTYNKLLQIVHPEDIPYMENKLQDCLNNSSSYEIELRIIRKDTGEIRNVKTHGRIISDNDNNPIKMYGATQDITEWKKVHDELRKTADEFNYLFNNMNDAIFVQNLQGNFLNVNETAVKRLGYSRDELLSMAAQDVDYKYPSSGVKEKIDEILETGLLKFESVHITNNGTKIPVEVNSTLIHYRDKPAVLSIARDITERKKAEEEKSVILNSTSEMIVFHNTEGKIKWCNKAFSKFTGFKQDELIGAYCYKLLHNKSDICDCCPISYIVKTGKHHEKITTFPNNVFNIKRDPVRDINGNIIGIISVSSDITDKVRAEEKIKEYTNKLEEINTELENRVEEQTEQIRNAERMRELELHHRIKNNLQVISSLINLQSEKFDDEEVYEAFIDTQNRIVSMSLVHQKLYQTSNLNSINFKDYIQDLLTHLTRLYGDNNITLDVDNIDNVYFDIDTIIPLAMLINELVSNSLKYAFSENESGEIKIMLHQIDNENYTLIVADNGRGIPEDIDIHDTDSLGLRLVNTLVDQIGGCLELERRKGSKFIIEFGT
ncbi:signal transduction histidine kinase [Methanohalobium evestigatum Z-7303]|uniref:Signal transduction histidine kinase n=1 Tax=Methanohalobium evestigatum (strain ATCC BAA-1072 / DSM 3721 / NBRC 107634 / OCM 161 / Z-7303) TaxID=644295 RepID=D7E7C5_METEZ|nr:PAS domain S-box protein [Methanohalobium evestigatum]ADI73874.1 signal transduction histidine kinase [Methanohalobium evestigatum Z-7303]